MRKSVLIVLFSVALTYVLFCLITLRVDLWIVDGPLVSLYGFPFLYRNYTHLSVTYEVDLIWLFLDFIIYYFIVLAAIALISIDKVYDFVMKYRLYVIAMLFSLSVIPTLESILSDYHYVQLDINKELKGGERGKIISKEIHIGYIRPNYTRAIKGAIKDR